MVGDKLCGIPRAPSYVDRTNVLFLLASIAGQT